MTIITIGNMLQRRELPTTSDNGCYDNLRCARGQVVTLQGLRADRCDYRPSGAHGGWWVGCMDHGRWLDAWVGDASRRGGAV